jgi:hypothetical protein
MNIGLTNYPRAHAAQYDWEGAVRFALGAFRVDAARAGAAAEVEPFIAELCRLSPEFKAIWDDNEVRGAHGEAVKHIRHPVAGPLASNTPHSRSTGGRIS